MKRHFEFIHFIVNNQCAITALTYVLHLLSELDLLLEMDTERTNASDIKRAYAKQGGKLVSSINDSQILHMSLSACFNYEVYFKVHIVIDNVCSKF